MALPAFSGDGYETTANAFMEELAFLSSNLMPDLVVVDPALFIREVPLNVISAAMTALTHAAEGFAGPEKNPFTDGYAHTAIRILVQHLADALSDDRGWRRARSRVATAETMAGTVFSNVRPGLTHVLAAAVAQKTGSSPGLCMGILLPYVLDHLSTREDYFVDSLLLPVAGPETFAITAGELRTGKVLTLIQELQFELYESTRGELPMNLEDLGLKRDQLKPLAASEADGAPKASTGRGA
jgi:alcohol dehydrogenase class IV